MDDRLGGIRRGPYAFAVPWLLALAVLLGIAIAWPFGPKGPGGLYGVPDVGPSGITSITASDAVAVWRMAEGEPDQLDIAYVDGRPKQGIAQGMAPLQWLP